MIAFLVWLAASGADPSAMLSLFGHNQMARGCPISETTVLTARHVATQETGQGYPPRGAQMVWSSPTASGSAWTLDYDLRRDVAILQTDVSVGQYYQIAEEMPSIGDKVVIAGYKYRGVLEMRTIETRIRNIVAVHLILHDAGEQGFSGSCVLNERNEVVGIYHWGIERDGTRRGIASGVWGPWKEIGWMPPER